MSTYPTGEVVLLPATSGGIIGTATSGFSETAAILWNPLATLAGTNGTSSPYSHDQTIIGRIAAKITTTASSAIVTMAGGATTYGLSVGMSVYHPNMPNGSGSLPYISAIGNSGSNLSTQFTLSSGSGVSAGTAEAEFFPRGATPSAGVLGMYLGSGCSALLSAWRIMPSAEPNIERLAAGFQLVGGDDNTGTHNSCILDTISYGTFNQPSHYRWTERRLSGGGFGTSGGSPTVADLSTHRYNQLNGPAAGGIYSSYCVRSSDYGQYGRVQLLADCQTMQDGGTKINCMPVEPIIYPSGGRFPFGSPTVTLRSQTTSAAIFYTVDGTTPTYSGSGTSLSPYVPTGTTQCYTKGKACSVNISAAGTGADAQYVTVSNTLGPFTITPTSGGAVVKAIAVDVNATTPSSLVWTSAPYYNFGFRNDGSGSNPNNWYDDEGYLIDGHGPCTYKENGRIYMSLFRCSAINQANNFIGNNPWYYTGTGLYTSEDGLNWHNEGLQVDCNGWWTAYCSAPVKCPLTGQYVVHANTFDYTGDYRGIMSAVGPSPQGPWKWVAGPYVFDYDASGSATTRANGDRHVFTDTDGTGYISYQNNNATVNTGIMISQLSPDYLTSTGTKTLISNTAEAPNLLKYPYVPGGTYFMLVGMKQTYFNSGDSLDGTDPLAGQGGIGYGDDIQPKYYYNTGPSPVTGTWVGPFSIFASTPFHTIHNAQPRAVFEINGQWVLFSDYWVNYSLYKSRITALPLRFPTATSIEVGVGGAGIPFASGWSGVAPASLPTTWNPPSGPAKSPRNQHTSGLISGGRL